MSVIVKGNQGQPRYVCESGEYVNKEEDFISSVLNPLYQENFKNKTKFSGVREFGLDNSLLLEKLLDGVLFRPFSVMVEMIKIFVYGLGVSNRSYYSKKIDRSSKKLTCTSKDWNNLNIMEPLYLYHLKSHTLADVDWYKLFKNWSLQSSNIIEIRSELSCIYPSDYIFNDREYHAWRSLIKAAGDTNITPFNKKESL
ncbi:12733_t:CDS:2 [Entrophospora sp. SA101]|nr:12733_t:CDS:2 [Entrophospora sp. SA101]